MNTNLIGIGAATPNIQTGTVYPYYTTNNSAGNTYTDINVDAQRVVFSDGDVLEDRLQRIEEALGIPTRNIKLEQGYPHLKLMKERASYGVELLKCRAIERLKQ